MTNSCDDVLGLIATGEKDIEGRPEVIEHLKGCARCRSEAPALVAAARAIRAAPDPAWAGHPASDRIVVLALDPEGAARDVDHRAAEHVAGCPTCAAEVRDVRRAEQARSRSRRPARRGLRALSGALSDALADLAHGSLAYRVAWATGLAVLALAYPAFLGLRQLPQVQGELVTLESRVRQLEAEIRERSASLAIATQAVDRLSHWSGPLRLFALSSPVRGQMPKQMVGLDPAEPFVLIGVRPILADPSAESDVYRIEIVDSHDKGIWSSELTAKEMRLQMKSAGTLIFPIPSTLLAPGRHELRVLPVKQPRQPILQIPFEIAPAD